MSRYYFVPGEALDGTFRRIIRKQLRAAGQAFATEDSPALAVHRTRRCLKRSRALIALLEPAYGRYRWAKEDKALNAAAKELAGARDEQAKLDALDRLAAHAGKQLPATAASRLRRALERKRAVREQVIDATRIQELIQALGKIGQSFRRKRLGRFDDRALVDGIVQTYRTGRKAMQSAYRTSEDTAFHAWRREVQSHWRHMQLVERCWPPEIGVRVEAAKALSGLLGDDHDLWLLMAEIDDRQLPIGAADRERMVQLCRGLQGKLRHEAKQVGRLLYTEKPRHMGRRLKSYWRIAVDIGEPIVPPAPSGEDSETDVARLPEAV